jgi:N-acyl-D-amino-acid deacylase
LQLDLLIKGGIVVDGTRHPSLQQDVGIKEGRIVAMEPKISATAARVIDATGLTVAPGFVDIHSHSDGSLPTNPMAESTLRQGITTVLGGQCGTSAPLQTAAQRQRSRERGEERNWSNFDEYFEELERRGIGVNLACLVGQGSVRGYVMGVADRPPTEPEMAEMKRLVAESMEAGAFGISTGRRYLPGSLASDEEVLELCRVAATYGGIYMSHIRNQDADIMASIAELINVGRQTGMRLQLSHQKVCGKPNWGQGPATLDLMAEARAEGIDILSDLYPYWFTQITQLAAYLPSWARAGSVDVLLQRLSDAEQLQRIRTELTDFSRKNPERWHSLQQTGIVWCPDTAEYIGWSWAEVMEHLNVDLIDAWIELLFANRGDVKCAGIMSEDDIQAIISHPFSMIGTDSFSIDGQRISPAEAHPRNYGTYPYVLQHYVREQGLLDLETAIYKMTGFPASRIGLQERGTLRVGHWADVVVFDLKTVADRASIVSPCEYPAGIDYVIVNGQLAVEQGKQLPVKAGQVLRHK